MEPEVIKEGGARVPDESVITATVQITWQETSCLQQNADLLIPPIRSHRGRIRPWRPFLQIPTLYLVVAVVAWMGVASLSFFAREAIFSAIGIKAGDWQWPWDTGEKRWQQDRRGGGRRGTAPRSSGDITSEATRELLETKVDEDYNTFVEVGGTARLNNDQDVLEAAFEEDFYNFFLEDSSSYPSSVPSASPNTEPTFTPTREPTTPGTRPTSTPTYNPTREPTIPVDGPTVPPTFNPTMFPTNEPDDFDCSRILDENGLVRYYWDFPFQDSDGNMNLRSRLTYFGMGWVGWGIPLASTRPKGFLNAGFVEGTDVVIGLSDLPRSRTNPGRYSIDGPSLADVNLLPDRAQTLREASVRQTRRRSDMTFTYVMNGAMSNPVNITGENTIVWAYGFSNALGLYRDRDSYLIDFGVCSETAAPTLVPTRVPTMTPTDDVYDCETVVDDNGLVKFSWVEPFRVGNNILLSARIVYSGLGWVGWAVPQSPDGDVEGSDAIIGIPSAPNSPTNPGKYSLDNWSLQGAELSPVIEQTLLNTLLTQSDEETTMVFTKILNETGANPVTYPGVMNTFLFAYGVSNELGFYRERGSFSTDFTCAPSSAPSAEPSVSTSPSISSPPSSAPSVLTKPSR